MNKAYSLLIRDPLIMDLGATYVKYFYTILMFIYCQVALSKINT